ncbi:uncharacterized protein Z519_11476 [Cladophialophora bantiana CBS 173.52]|uniref:Apoptosis regulator Bcl-2 family BH4 domain-containing protein n=1 Tax=Cladophialophora bantiana (strain ATCC 10958 / CBS 173.52 / CDC B-1940 / NIH 8579) TaxID=1442370 RepID=A0A0D2FMF8_CLAB1|nr:uncharacterized protein Z519_11476 [Cladophialophora bantiana CBS 173.52]KIW87892.1 hypothetical protein Z519_11476 [Cladophialophora bantiana CBS 173.52]
MEPPIPPDHHFAPVDPDIRVMRDRFEDRFDDRFVEEPAFFEERAPSVQQRFDRMSLQDDDLEEIRPRAERVRSTDTVPTAQDYLYYRLSKRGDDWSSCVKKPINAPVDEIERKARRGRGGDGPVLEQLTRMPTLRRSMLDEVVRKANDQETGDARWEVVYIKSKRVQTRKGKMEVPDMDVILARTRDRSRSRAKSFGGEKVRKVEVVREKRYTNDSYGRARKDSVLDKLEDPVANLPLFEADGTPRDELGPMHFNNANLPPYIARETPLGHKPEKKNDKPEKKRGKSRSKSRDRGAAHDEDGVYVVPEVQDFATDAVDPAPVDAVFVEGPTDRRGRRGQSPHEHPVVVVESDARRSHSRHRVQPEARSKSRRRESVHFPNQHTQQYFDAGYASSENSDTSHYGFAGEYAESSNTSLSTPGGVPRRGSLVYAQGRPDVVYKKHHPGPSRRQSYVERPYHGEQQQVVVPAVPRRNSYVVYDRQPAELRQERHPRLMRQATAPIPEDRQIVYRDSPRRSREQDVIPLRRYTTHESAMPIVHYHHADDERDGYFRDELDRQSIRVEDYQRDRVLEDHLSRREQQLTARERELEMREDELRRVKRQRELEGEREYYDDRDFRRERRETRKLYYDARTGEHFFYND